MSLFAVTNRRAASPTETPAAQPETLGARLRRALILSGWLALVLGQALGVLAANPRLLTSHLPFALDPVVMVLVGFSVASILTGVVAGLALRGASVWLRLAVALFGMLVALIAFDVTFGLLRGLTLAAALMSISDEVKLGQAALGIAGAALGIQAGRMPTPAASTAPAPAGSRRRRATRSGSAASERASSGTGRQTPRRRRTATASASSSATGAASVTPASVTPASVTPASASATSATPAASAAPRTSSISIGVVPKSSARPPKRRRSLFSRRKVHLGAEQTAVCPYCLEEVRPNDPRGRVVCQICGTPHHADCWAITGKCEVPHLQT